MIGARSLRLLHGLSESKLALDYSESYVCCYATCRNRMRHDAPTCNARRVETLRFSNGHIYAWNKADVSVGIRIGMMFGSVLLGGPRGVTIGDGAVLAQFRWLLRTYRIPVVVGVPARIGHAQRAPVGTRF